MEKKDIYVVNDEDTRGINTYIRLQDGSKDLIYTTSTFPPTAKKMLEFKLIFFLENSLIESKGTPSHFIDLRNYCKGLPKINLKFWRGLFFELSSNSSPHLSPII